MKIKKGVVLAGLQIPMRTVLKKADRLWKQKGKELVITSGLEGTHSAGSLHYYGYALDFRTRYFTAIQCVQLQRSLATALGPEYVVLFEGNHMHVQYGRAKTYI